MKTLVRPPAVSGRFYPADPSQLRDELKRLLSSAAATSGPVPKAIIVPHAGYIYSGAIAATAYARLLPGRATIRRVVLLGPAHFVTVRGLAAPTWSAFATPLGEVKVDSVALAKLKALPQVEFNDDAHAPDHCLEVQLPFLQTVLDEFAIVPLLVGDAESNDVREILDLLWGGAETLFVISSDLSHFLDLQSARQIDKRTAEAIIALKPELLGSNQACGRIPIRGLLQSASDHGLHGELLDLRNSGETAGSPERVVGYGAFAFTS